MMPKKKSSSQQKVNLTERLAQGGGAQRRESSQSETGFGTDQLFDDDPQAAYQGAATPNPEHRKRTIKSMSHKMAKTFRFSKGSSSSTVESQPPPGARDSNSGTEQIPSLSSSPVMTHKSPTSSDEVWSDISETSSHLEHSLLSPVSCVRIKSVQWYGVHAHTYLYVRPVLVANVFLVRNLSK